MMPYRTCRQLPILGAPCGPRRVGPLLRPQDWTSGDHLRVVEVIAPFGPAGGGQASFAEEMVKDLKAKVFPDREVKFRAFGTDAKPTVRSV